MDNGVVARYHDAERICTCLAIHRSGTSHCSGSLEALSQTQASNTRRCDDRGTYRPRTADPHPPDRDATVMTLISIILATLAGGIVSVLLAATLALSMLARFADKMVAFAVGVLLTFALTDILPEAVNLGLDIEQAGWVLLVGLAGFFLLEKGALWRHDHAKVKGRTSDHPRVAMIILGDGLHNFVDGVLIAAAFLTDSNLGWAAALAVMAHEIPQEISDFMVLLGAGVSRLRALALNALSGAAMTLGGVLGWLALDRAQIAIPYILTLAAASFIYIAVADLVPELHSKPKPQDTVIQLTLMLLGVCTAKLAHLLH